MRAAREVILCGGAINSPQLLLLSGIGPQQHLTDLGIAVAHHLPGVGQSMQDHYQARIVCKCRFPITVNDIMLSKTRMVKTGLEYLLFRKGALAIAAAQAGLFARTRPELATPDIQYRDGDVQCRPSGRGAAQVLGLLAGGLSASPGKPRRVEAEDRRTRPMRRRCIRTTSPPKPTVAPSSTG